MRGLSVVQRVRLNSISLIPKLSFLISLYCPNPTLCTPPLAFAVLLSRTITPVPIRCF